MSFNKIIIVGNLGKDPVLRYTPQEIPVTDFTVATSEKKGDKEVTTWFKVTAWRKLAENSAKYLKKGNQAYIEGVVSVEEWEDKDGGKRYTLKVDATEIKFIGSKNQETQETREEPELKPNEEGDIPF